MTIHDYLEECILILTVSSVKVNQEKQRSEN
jgi:hypothetical protein